MSASLSFASSVESVNAELGPTEIRALRGNRSRASFAAMLRITPLTVYRWEQPFGAPQARRPRGRHLDALRALARPSVTAEVPPLEMMDDLFAELDLGRWDLVERRLQRRAAFGAVETVDGRALSTVAVAHARAFGRSDLGGAIFLVAPLLQNPTVSTTIAARTHLVAAYVFAIGDDGLFDPERAHDHAERAQTLSRSGDFRAFIRVIQLEALSRGGSVETFLLALIRAASELDAATAPVTCCLVSEIRAKGARFASDDAAERHHLRAALGMARAIGFTAAQGRILSRLARHPLEDSGDREGVGT